MVRGLYTSALGMITQMDKMAVVSNNIANVNTSGFKKDVAVTQSFSEEMFKRLDDPKNDFIKHSVDIGKTGLGVFVSSVNTDFSAGAFEETDGSLDLVLDGDGFFTVSVTDGNGNAQQRYTRDGSFKLAQDGTLMTSEGNFVMGQGGIIKLEPNAEIKITSTGAVYSGDEFVDNLMLVDVGNKETLRKQGDNLYAPIDETEFIPYTGRVVTGYVESSNVNAVEEMVKMITLSRVYEANQKMIQTHDSTLQRAVNDIGKKS